MFTHLVLSGGGLHGMCMLGALSQFNLSKVKHSAGSSVGAIICVLLSFMSIEEIYHFTQNNQFLDDDAFDITNIVEKYGLIDPCILLNCIQELFETHLSISNPTFAELYSKTKKNVIVTGTNVSKVRSECFSHKHTPSMFVLKAIEISISVPFIFNMVIHNKDVYADGCVMNMTPEFVFSDIDSSRKLCITIDKKTNCCDKPSFFEYTSNVIRCAIAGQKKHENPHSMVIVPNSEIDFIQKYSKCDIITLYDEGVLQAVQYIKKRH